VTSTCILYGGTTATEVIKHNDGSFTNEVRALRYDEDSIFTVNGAPKSFSQLMAAAYGYVIAVNHKGVASITKLDIINQSPDEWAIITVKVTHS